MREKPLYVVERMGPLRMPGELCDLPRIKRCENLPGQFVALGLKPFNFTLKIQLTIPVDAAKFVYLGLKINDGLLKIEGSTHYAAYFTPDANIEARASYAALVLR